MQRDSDVLEVMAEAQVPPTLRFFRFASPTVTCGRLQDLGTAQQAAPVGWPVIRRPTAGGIVLHDGDLCFSLCWRAGTPPLPERPRDIYREIHRLAAEALKPYLDLRLASCCDTPEGEASFHERRCFAEPVGFDVLSGSTKVIGGALAFRRGAVLYQGSIQPPVPLPDAEAALTRVFANAFGLS